MDILTMPRISEYHTLCTRFFNYFIFYGYPTSSLGLGLYPTLTLAYKEKQNILWQAKIIIFKQWGTSVVLNIKIHFLTII